MMSPANNCVTKDEAEAVNWYRKAAEQGYAKAQSNLGFMYSNGYGVPKDETAAYMWYLLASGKGNEIARETGNQMRWNEIANLLEDAELATRWLGLGFFFTPAEWQVQTQSGQRFLIPVGCL
jgi:TPR repeat protein